VDAFDLRDKLFKYTGTHYKELIELQLKWNEKLKRGIPISDEFLFDLFGHEILASFDEEEIMVYNDLKVIVCLCVNEENPFQAVFAYKVEPLNSNVKQYELFLAGQENMLFQYLNEKGAA
jgi:hypothetical protein